MPASLLAANEPRKRYRWCDKALLPRPVHSLVVDSVKNASADQREAWLARAERQGHQHHHRSGKKDPNLAGQP